MNKKGIIDHMIIIIGIDLCSLNECCSAHLLKRIFNIHINTENIYKSDFLQKLNAFRKEIIVAGILQSEFWRGI